VKEQLSSLTNDSRSTVALGLGRPGDAGAGTAYDQRGDPRRVCPSGHDCGWSLVALAQTKVKFIDPQIAVQATFLPNPLALLVMSTLPPQQPFRQSLFWSAVVIVATAVAAC
jgi:hypothetical protein